MKSFRSDQISRVHVFGLIVAALFVLTLAFSPARSQAATEPFKIDFDQSTMQFGMLSDLPLGELASTGSLDGTIDETGKVTIPKGNFKLPEIGITTPVTVKVFMGIESDATGTFDEQTGDLVLDAKAGVWISVNLPELFKALEGFGLDISSQLGPLSGIVSSVGDLTCGFSPMNVKFTTGSTSLGSGQPFTEGPLGPGAITAEWSQLGKFAGKTKILGLIDACQMIKQYAPTLLEGAIGGSLPEGIDLGDLDLASLLENLDNVNLGPSSLTLTRTLDENPEVVVPPTAPKLRITLPKKRVVKNGRATALVVKVRNAGGSTATGVKLCLNSPAVKVLNGNRCRSLGNIAAGRTLSPRYRVKLRQGKKRSVKVRFTVRAGNATRSASGSQTLIRRR